MFTPRLPKDKDANITSDGPGLYRVSVRLKRDDGTLFEKQARKIKTKAEARRRRDLAYEEFNVREGGPQYAQVLAVKEEQEHILEHTLADWAEKCITTFWPQNVPATARDYTQSMRHHVLPVLGEVPIGKLTSNQIRDFVYDLSKKDVVLKRGKNPPVTIKLSVNSLKMVKAALSACLSLAVERGVIPVNPALALKIKWTAIDQQRNTNGGDEEDEHDKRLLTRTELAELARVTEGTPVEWLVLLQGYMGLRIAEALSVRGKDFDLDAGVLKLRKQIKWVELPGEKGKLMPTDPKTKNARRDIPIPPVLKNRVKARIEVIGEDRPFAHNVRGTWLDPRKAQTLFREAFEKAKLVRQRGKADPTTHSLRFTFISHLLNDLKQPPSVVQQLAGHSGIAVTLGYYSRATMENLSEAMSLLGDL